MTQNHFEHFGLPRQFDIDLKALGQAYRKRQQESHPDRFAHAEISEQRQAVQATALNTEIFQVLKSPVPRGCYLLNLEGVDFDLNTYTVSDMNLLMEQMKYREQLAVIKEKRDESDLMDLDDMVTDKVKSISTEIGQLFDADVESNAEKIKVLLCELQFFEKLKHECELVEEQLLMD